jgi:Rrf2 family protein
MSRQQLCCEDVSVHVSAKSDYAIRALLSLAARQPQLVKAEVVAREQQLPRKFVEAILAELRRSGIVRTQRGAEGGYGLARPASDISLGDIFRAVDGPLTEVRGVRPHETTGEGLSEHLPAVWIALRAAMRQVLDETTLAHVLSGKLPRQVQRMAADPAAWLPR